MGKNYDQLSIDARAMIPPHLEMGGTPAARAKAITRSASPVSRELRRHGWSGPTPPRGPGRPAVAGGYRAEAAPNRAHGCTSKPRGESRLRPEPTLWDSGMQSLNGGYSPEQVAGTRAGGGLQTPLPCRFRDPLHRHLGHAAWRTAHGRDWLVARRPCQAPPPYAWRSPAWADS